MNSMARLLFRLLNFWLTLGTIVLLGFEVFKDFKPYATWTIIVSCVNMAIYVLLGSKNGMKFCIGVLIMQFILALLIV